MNTNSGKIHFNYKLLFIHSSTLASVFDHKNEYSVEYYTVVKQNLFTFSQDI